MPQIHYHWKLDVQAWKFAHCISTWEWIKLKMEDIENNVRQFHGNLKTRLTTKKMAMDGLRVI